MSYTYDAASRRATMTVAGQPPVSYTYDQADRLTQLTRGAETAAFGYDATNRRTSLTLPNGVVISSTYDAAIGNRIQIIGPWAWTGLPDPVTTTAHDAANRLTQWGASTLTYDLNGNLTHDGTQTYTWNARDQLLALPAATFVYDAVGRRQRRVVGGTTTDFVYDGLTPVQEQDGTQVVAAQLTGLGIDEYLGRTDAAGTRYLLPDALGSTLALTDPAGAVQTEYTYAPFGATTASDPSSSNPHQLTRLGARTTGSTSTTTGRGTTTRG